MRTAQVEEENKTGREREPKRKALGKCSYTMARLIRDRCSSWRTPALRYSTAIRWNR